MHHVFVFLRSRLWWRVDVLLWKLERWSEWYNPYARIAALMAEIQHLSTLLDHASCVCGQRLRLSTAYGCIACERCQRLAIADHPHGCDVYLGHGHYWCRSCVVAVASLYQLVAPDVLEVLSADPTLVTEWIEGLPEGHFLHLVHEAEQRVTSVDQLSLLQ